MFRLSFKSTLCIVVLTLSLSGCDFSQNGNSFNSSDEASTSSEEVEAPHVHTFNDYWSKDENEHWHESSCTHDGEKLRKDVEKHDFSVTETAPTYQSEGVRTYQCRVCGYSYQETIAQLTHTYSNEWTSDPTGHYHVCLDKGYETVKKDFAKHDYVVTETPASYDSKGKLSYVCKICGYSYEKETSQLVHRFSDDWSSDETGHYHACIDEGYEDLHIDFKEHDFDVEEVDATYEEEGSKKYTCKTCGYIYTETIDKVKHEYAEEYTVDEKYHWYNCTDEGYEDLFVDKCEHDFEATIVDPTYEEKGYTLHTCKVCGYSYADSEVDELEHHYSEEWSKDNWRHWHKCIDDGYEDLKSDYELHHYTEQVIAPTFTAFGYSIFTCDDCGFKYIQYGNEYKPHEFSTDWDNDENNHWHNCIDDGYEELSSDNSSHAYGKWIMNKIPDGTNKGEMHKECTVCGYKDHYVDIPAEAGNYKEYLYYSTYTNGTCQITGLRKNVEFVYIPEEIDGYTVTSISSSAFSNRSSIKQVYISDTVTDINNSAFSYCSNLEMVVLSTKLSYIYSYAFSGCGKLNDINFPKSLSYIYYGSFQNCTSLESVYIEGKTYIEGYNFYNCTSLKSVDAEHASRLCYDCFNGCTALEEVKLPRITNLNESEIFFGCTSLKKVYIPKELTSLQSNCFNGCTSLSEFVVEEGNTAFVFDDNALYSNLSKTYILYVSRTVTGEYIVADGVYGASDYAFRDCSFSSIFLPKSYNNSISGSIFNNCTNLTSITIDDDNPYYQASDAAVYSKNGKTLYTVLKNSISGEYTIKSGVETINYNAFSNCEELTKINFPDSLKYLNSSVFSGCTKLENVSIPETVSTLPSSCFSDCSSLKTVDLGKVSSIQSNVFYNCTSLEEINFPDELTRINSWAFYYCSSLESIDLNNVTTLGSYAFYYCQNLETIKLPNVTSFNYYNFAYCSKLTNITLNSELTAINADCVFYNCDSLTDLSPFENLTAIGNGFFNDCDSLEEVDLSALTTIGQTAFNSCSKLKEVSLSSVTSISYSCFYWCIALESISAPNVTSIGDYAFYYCRNLKEFDFDLSKATSIGYDAFYNDAKITTPIVLSSSTLFYGYCFSVKVYFEGTSSELSTCLQNGYPLTNNDYNYVYYYRDTEPSESGNYWHYEGGVPTSW